MAQDEGAGTVASCFRVTPLYEQGPGLLYWPLQMVPSVSEWRPSLLTLCTWV